MLMKVKVLAAQLYPTLCEAMGGSLPGCSVPGILQARILEWVAIPNPGIKLDLLHCRQILYHLSHEGSPLYVDKGELFL